MKTHQAGFTLVETLVAAVILFAVLTSASLAFQSAIISSAKAETRVRMLAVVPRVRNEVTQQMRVGNRVSGNGVMGAVQYEWSAVLSTSGSALNIDATDAMSGSAPEERVFNLWRVTMSLELSGSQREFAFTELTWGA